MQTKNEFEDKLEWRSCYGKVGVVDVSLFADTSLERYISENPAFPIFTNIFEVIYPIR
jgi:hypothetical protein